RRGGDPAGVRRLDAADRAHAAGRPVAEDPAGRHHRSRPRPVRRRLMIQSIDYAAVAPPLILAVAAIGLLLADAFGVPGRALSLLSGAALAVALAAVAVLAYGDRRATFCLPDGLRGGGPASCSYVADDFTLLFQGIVLAAAVV